MTSPTPDNPGDDPRAAALERLAAALDPGDYITTLVSGQGRVPHLAVSSRHAQLGDEIVADGSAFWWSWAERIAGVEDPLAAARKISSVLRAAPERSRG
jgi:hypothetical protein